MQILDPKEGVRFFSNLGGRVPEPAADVIEIGSMVLD